MAKYDPLKEWLLSQNDSVSCPFSRIEELVGPLPASARVHRAWWGNNRSHVQARAWLDAGFSVASVKSDVELVIFRRTPRDRTMQPSPSKRRRASKPGASGAPFRTDLEKLAAMRDEDIDLSDNPEADDEWFAKAEFRPGKVPPLPVPLDAHVLAWFMMREQEGLELAARILTDYVERQEQSG
jgi:hypothetical protein